MRAAAVSTSLLVLLTLSACSGSGTTPADDPPAPAAPTPAPSSATPTAGATGPSTPSATPTAEPTPEGFPELEVEVLADDLTLPWDVDELAGGGLLVTEKESGRILLLDGDQRRELSGGPSGLWSSGETGLMSIVVDPPTRTASSPATVTATAARPTSGWWSGPWTRTGRRPPRATP